MLPRRSFLEVEIDSTDISKEVSDVILDFTYTDRASGESDSIDLNVTDRDGKFIDNWYPENGLGFKAKIKVENWNQTGDSGELDTGKFKIDSCGLSGPPDKFSIKAVSIPITSSLKREEKTNTWEEATLQEIAKTIADKAGIQLMYEVESDIKFDRVDQLQQTDMAFLMDLCTRYGVSLKVTDEKMVLFEESVYEGKDPIDTFDKSEIGSRIINYSFTQDTNDTVKKVELFYKDPKSGIVAQGEFTPPNPPATEQKLVLNERPGDLRGDNFRNGVDDGSGSAGGTFDTGMHPFNDITADFDKPRTDVTDNANIICKARCREKNKKEWTCTLKLLGNVNMVGGVTVNITNWGRYSGKYMVDVASHKIGGGYLTTINAHRVLGY
jgi:hypothetical protein